MRALERRMFSNNPGERDARRVVHDEARLLRYRRKIETSLNNLHDELGRLVKDINDTTSALRNLLERANLAVPAERKNLIGHINTLKDIYLQVAKLHHQGEPRDAAEAAATIARSLQGIATSVERSELRTKQDIAERISGVFTASGTVADMLAGEQSRLYRELEAHTQLIRRMR